MKKSKLLVGVLVASMALLGTGYAYWTDTLTIKGTVKTGELEVKYTTTVDSSTGEFNGTPEKSPEITNPATEPTYKKITLNRGVVISKDFVKPAGSKGYSWDVEATNTHQKINSKYYHNGTYTGKLDKCAHCNSHISLHYYVVDKEGSEAEWSDLVEEGETVVLDNVAPDSLAAAKGANQAAGYVTTPEVLIREKGKGVKIKIDGMYPGSFASATFTAQNTGSIPAVIDQVQSNMTIVGVGEEIKVVALINNEAPITDELLDTANAAGLKGDLAELSTILEKAYQDVILEPTGDNTTVTTTLIFILPGAVESYNGRDGKYTQDIDLTITWTQHNKFKEKQDAPTV